MTCVNKKGVKYYFMEKEYKLVDSVETLGEAIRSVKEAQDKFAKYSQEEVDKIFFAAAMAANRERIPLAKMAVEETRNGCCRGQSY